MFRQLALLFIGSVRVTAQTPIDELQLPPNARMSFLRNEEITLGVDLNRGGAIVYLSRRGDGNLINNFDLGRQVQLSFYSGPIPYSEGGQQPAEHWKHLGWNPVQSGDDFDNGSEVLHHVNDGKSIRVVCRPLLWPLKRVPGECTFETSLSLDGPVVRAKARLSNARTGQKLYPAMLQELPAVYANASCFRVASYTGDKPFTGDTVSEIAPSSGPHPWAFWQGTEHWSALLDANNRGLGLLTPGRTHFTGGFAGQPGASDTRGNSTGYLASQGEEILDPDIVYDYRFELLAGSLDEIRKRAREIRSPAPLEWVFAADRQGWHYQNATDSGWPIAGQLDVGLDQTDPQLISPWFFHRAEAGSQLRIEAAFTTSATKAVLFWQRHGDGGFKAGQSKEFAIIGDGVFRTYAIVLERPDAFIRLRLDPTPGSEAGSKIRLRSIRFAPPE